MPDYIEKLEKDFNTILLNNSNRELFIIAPISFTIRFKANIVKFGYKSAIAGTAQLFFLYDPNDEYNTNASTSSY